MKKVAAAIAATCMAAGLAGPAQAEAFYEGKDITLLVGFSPGGGTDQFARIVADHLGQHIDGEPAMVVQNMPGSGSVLASNHYVSRVNPDGETLMVGTGQLLMRIMLGLQGSRASLDQYYPLMAGPQGRATFVSTELGIDGVQDLVDGGEEFIHGSAGILASIDTLMGMKLLDVPVRAITGYPGKADTLLAFERGEVNLDGQTHTNYLTKVVPLVEAGQAQPLFTQGFIDDAGNLVRDPAIPDVPTVLEVYREAYGKDPSGPAWSAYMAMTGATVSLGRVLKIHSDAPDEAKQALEAGVDRMLQDAEFLKAVETALKGYQPYGGAPLKAAVAATVGMSESDQQWMKDWLTSEHGAKFE